MAMNYRYLIPLLAAGFLAACDSSGPEDTPEASAGTAPAPSAPEAPSAETRAAIEGQAIGGKLLGKMVRLDGDAFVPADPLVVPEAYFIYYSASW